MNLLATVNPEGQKVPPKSTRTIALLKIKSALVLVDFKEKKYVKNQRAHQFTTLNSEKTLNFAKCEK